MIKKLKGIMASVLLLGAVSAPVAVPAIASAAENNDQVTSGLCSGSNLEFTTGTGCTVDSEEASGKLNSIIKTTINVVSIVVGLVAVIMIVFGGLKYITSGGESNNVSSAKNTIIYAIIGLVVVALAQFVVRFVLDKSINTVNS